MGCSQRIDYSSYLYEYFSLANHLKLSIKDIENFTPGMLIDFAYYTLNNQEEEKYSSPTQEFFDVF